VLFADESDFADVDVGHNFDFGVFANSPVEASLMQSK